MSKKQDPVLLKEFMNFGTMFGLHFLQDIFGNQPEGVDEKYDEWKEGQANLQPIMKKWQEMEDKKMSPKEKQKAMAAHKDELAKAMNSMPRELKGKALEQFQTGAARAYLQSEKELGTAFGEVKELVVDLENKIPAIAGLGEEKAVKIKKFVRDNTKETMKSVLNTWKMLTDSMVDRKRKHPDDISDAVYRAVNPEGFLDKVGKGFGDFLKESAMLEANRTQANLGAYGGSGGGKSKEEAAKEIKQAFATVAQPLRNISFNLRRNLIQNYLSEKDTPSPFGVQPETANQWVGELQTGLERLVQLIGTDIPNEIVNELGAEEIKESIVLERKFRKIFYEHFGDFS